MSGTDSMVKCGLAAVQIGTAVLVKLVSFGICVNCLQREVMDCLNCEGGGSNLQRKLIII